MIEHRVVVHFRGGEIVKGRTFDFSPTKDSFHITTLKDEKQIVTVFTSLIKAVFFVKSFRGNKNHETHEEFSMDNFKFDDTSLKIRVDFLDGEVMSGMTNGYSPNRKGFFVFPADKKTNNERVFVVKGSTCICDNVDIGKTSSLAVIQLSKTKGGVKAGCAFFLRTYICYAEQVVAMSDRFCCLIRL